MHAIPALAVNDLKIQDNTTTYVEDDDDEPKLYTPSCFEKFLNYLLCRGDIANQKLEAQPVSIVGLVSFSLVIKQLYVFAYHVQCHGVIFEQVSERNIFLRVRKVLSVFLRGFPTFLTIARNTNKRTQ